MKTPWKVKQPWSEQIWSKKIGENVKIFPNMLLTVRNNRLYPASHDDILDGVAVDDVTSATWGIGDKECAYYPYHPTTLFETEVTNWTLSDEDVGLFFNICHDSQYVDHSTRWIGRQLRLENVLSDTIGEFTLRRNPYPEMWRPWVPWPRGVSWPPWVPGPRGEQWPQSDVPGPRGEKWEKWEKWDKWDKWEAFTYKDFTNEQKSLLRGERWDPWPRGEKWEKWDKWDKWDKWESMSWWWTRNSWTSYPPMTVVHYEWSAWICTEVCLNKEPWYDKQRHIFAQWGYFLPNAA